MVAAGCAAGIPNLWLKNFARTDALGAPRHLKREDVDMMEAYGSISRDGWMLDLPISRIKKMQLTCSEVASAWKTSSQLGEICWANAQVRNQSRVRKMVSPIQKSI